ncbi:MAG: outer membrane beta-barrel protein [Prolixibacteraceae bacterium]|nr:outer membrane beta-barrel protein [Prolixibacteraceae bacterium]
MNSKIVLLVFLMIVSVKVFSQDKMTFGVNFGYDYNDNYLENLYGAENINEIPDFNVGIDVGVELTERIRVRGELKYVNLSFTRDFSYPEAEVNIDKTKIATNFIGFNPKFDYRLFSLGNFDTYFSTGMRLEFSSGDYIRTYNYDGEKLVDTKHIGNGKYVHKSTMAGVVGGFIFKYNVNQNLGITIIPEYTSFLTRFYEQNMTSLQRANVNIGLEWTF